jgi:hypothetical protein
MRHLMLTDFEDVSSYLNQLKLKGQWHRKILLAISILLDDLTMKILSFRSETF